MVALCLECWSGAKCTASYYLFPQLRGVAGALDGSPPLGNAALASVDAGAEIVDEHILAVVQPVHLASHAC